jgi:hypothetical protein
MQISLKKLPIYWNILIVLGLAFALAVSIVWWLEDRTQKEPLGTIIACILAILYFGKELFERVYQQSSNVDVIEQRKDLIVENTLFGHIVLEHEIELDLQIDGSVIYKSKRSITITDETLESYTSKFDVIGDAKFEDLDLEIFCSRLEQNIEKEINYQESQSFVVTLRFSPALKKGEQTDFTIKYNAGKSYLMTREEVTSQIATKKWIFNEPYEYLSLGVRATTKNLKMRVIFPKNYSFYGTEYFDVFPPQSFQRISSIWTTLKTENAVRRYNSTDFRPILELATKNPEFGVYYFLKWMPPSASELQQIQL